MSTNVKLVGISRGELGGLPPRIVASAGDLGFSGLRDLLDIYSERYPDVLRPYNQEEPGFHQHLVIDPQSLVEHVKANPNFWDEVGYGFDYAIACLEKDHLIDGHILHWWFIVEY